MVMSNEFYDWLVDKAADNLIAKYPNLRIDYYGPSNTNGAYFGAHDINIIFWKPRLFYVSFDNWNIEELK